MAEFPHIFIQAPTREAFETALTDGRVSQHQIAFIEDTHEIWARGKYYPCPYTKAEIDQMIKNLDDSKVDLDTYNAAIEKLENSLKELPVADEEDITVTADNKLQLKDRDSSRGMGYKILRLPEDGILTQGMINEPNTIYEIRYNFDLNGTTINIPENCILKFEGGSLNDGTVNFSDTSILNIEKGFNNCTLVGYIHTDVMYVSDYYQTLNKNALKFILSQIGHIREIYFEKDKTSQVDFTYDDVKWVTVNGESISRASLLALVDCRSNTFIDFNGLVIDITSNTVNTECYLITFKKCNNIIVKGLTVIDTSGRYDTDNYSTNAIGIIDNCNNINIEVVGKSLKSVVGGHYWESEYHRYNLLNSKINVSATNCSYPIRIAFCDNCEFDSKYNNVHRGGYYAAVTNCKIKHIGKNPKDTQCHCLLRDAFYWEEEVKQFFECKNVNVYVEDTGSDYELEQRFIQLCAVSPYTDQDTFEGRTRTYSFENIKVTAVLSEADYNNTTFYPVSAGKSEGPYYQDLIDRFDVECHVYNPQSIVRPIETRNSFGCSRKIHIINETFGGTYAYTPLIGITENDEIHFYNMRISPLEVGNIEGKIIFHNCYIHNLNGRDENASIYIDDDTKIMQNPSFDDKYPVILKSTRLFSSGNAKDIRNVGLPYVGEEYFDTMTKKPIWWDGTQWINPLNDLTSWKIIR